MKKYLLFTADNFDDDYSVFQGDYDSLGEAFRNATAQAYDEEKLCVYRIVTWKPHAQVKSMPQVFRAKVQRCVAQGFVNGELRDCRGEPVCLPVEEARA
jgi:hypothetical protein